MCYDGALVMPSNYVVMNEEEMTYVEGGDKVVYHSIISFTRYCDTKQSAYAVAKALENCTDVFGVVGTIGGVIYTPIGLAWLGNIYCCRIAREVRNVANSNGCRIVFVAGLINVLPGVSYSKTKYSSGGGIRRN